MQRTSIYICASLLAAAIGLAGCSMPTTPFAPDPSAPAESGDKDEGSVRFSFGTDTQAKSLAITSIGLPDNLSAVLISIKDAEGATIFDKEVIDLIPFGNGYISGSIALEVGDYTVTEFVIVDETNAARFATPLSGSELEDLVEHPLPVAFSVSVQESETVTLEVLEIAEDSGPEQFGYVAFAPILVIPPFPFTFQVSRDEGGILTPIPFTFDYTSKSRANGTGSASTHHYKNQRLYPADTYLFIPDVVNGELFKLAVRSYGYRTSPKYEYTTADLYPLRDQTPTVTIVLEPELSQAVISYLGEDEAGNHTYSARLAGSGFIDDAIASFGGTESDIYSFTIGFMPQYWASSSNPYLPEGTVISSTIAPSGGSEQLVFVPYDSSDIQGMDEYTTLEAEFSVNAERHAVLQDSGFDKIMVVYVEVLALRGDGSDPAVIDGDEEFLGFDSDYLMLDTHQITIE